MSQKLKNKMEDTFYKKLDELLKDAETPKEVIEKGTKLLEEYSMDTAGFEELVEEKWNEIHGGNHG